MSVEKGTAVAEDAIVDASTSGDEFDLHGGTADDRADMLRLGKVQELKVQVLEGPLSVRDISYEWPKIVLTKFQRNFNFISMFGFSMLLMATWEVALSVIASGLVEGGTAGVIWLFFIVWVSFIFVNLSMAEMGSM